MTFISLKHNLALLRKPQMQLVLLPYGNLDLSRGSSLQADKTKARLIASSCLTLPILAILTGGSIDRTTYISCL